MAQTKPGRVPFWIAAVLLVAAAVLHLIPFYSRNAGGNDWWAFVCLGAAIFAVFVGFKLKWTQARARAAAAGWNQAQR